VTVKPASPAQNRSTAPGGAGRPAFWRRRLHGLSVRRKIALTVLAALLATLSASVALTLYQTRAQALHELRHRGEDIVEGLAHAVERGMVTQDAQAPSRLLAGLTGHPDILFAQVVSANGALLAAHGERPADANRVLSYERRIEAAGREPVTLQLTLSPARRIAHLESPGLIAVLHQFLVIAIVMTVVLAALTRFFVRPLSALGEQLRAAGEKGCAPRLPAAGNDEISELARHFNALHARLEEMQRRLQSRVDSANANLMQANRQLAEQAEELRRRNHDLQMLALTDPLTGLYNQRYVEGLMQNEIGPAIYRDETCSLLLIALDKAGDCEDRHGRAAVDALLRETAKRLVSNVRGSDVLCRLDDARFLLLCRGATMANAITIADHLQEAVSHEAARVGGLLLPVALRIGIATVPGRRPVRDPEEFLRCADVALSQSRSAGQKGIAHYAMLESPHTVQAGL
jgi:diguanylate cyclase (GGDEF)-like protein